MSVEAFAWALGVPVGGNAKIMLLGLANHAHPDGTESYPGLDTLAKYAFCDRSTARRNVRKLVELGWVQEDGVGSQGQIKYRLRMASDPWKSEGGEMPPTPNGVANTPGGGGKNGVAGVAAVPPEPTEPTKNREEEARERESRIPDGFPDELRPHARAVLPILRAVAKDHNAKEIKPLALGRMMMGRPHKPFVKSAHDFAAWAVDPSRPIRDVIASYRTWLDRAPDLAGPERLPGEPGPVGSPAPRPAGGPPGSRDARRAEADQRAEADLEAIRRLTEGE